MFSARKFIEVATFRSGRNNSTSAKGMVLRDNFYGSLEDDVFRRDFTVNGLYFDLQNSEVIDYVGGQASNIIDHFRILQIKVKTINCEVSSKNIIF